jgi:hypothetical protein
MRHGVRGMLTFGGLGHGGKMAISWDKLQFILSVQMLVRDKKTAMTYTVC